MGKILKRAMSMILLMAIVLDLIPFSAILNGAAKVGEPSGKNGGKYRIGYVGMRSSVNHPINFNAIVMGLEQEKWIHSTQGFPALSFGAMDTKPMWEWLSTQKPSSYLEFVADAYYFTDGIDEAKSKAVASAIIDRLNNKKDIDLMIVMGTYAAQLVANDQHKVPCMVFSTSNPIQAGIVKSETDSGKDHVWAHMYPRRFQSQVEVFHDIFKFKKLGLVYADTVTGRAFAAIDDVIKVSKEKGFEVHTKVVEDKQKDTEKFYRETQEAYRQLAEEVDAMYLTIYDSRKFDMLPPLLATFQQKKVPVFTQLGAEVSYGALMSVTDASDVLGLGSFFADGMGRALKGESLRKISQVYNIPPRIVLNLEAAKKTGYKPPFEILMIADEIYTKIGG